MRLTFNQKELRESLGDILAIVAESNITPLSRVLKLETDNGAINAYLGNGETYIKQIIPGTIVLEGSCALYISYLHELVKNLTPTELVELIFEDNRIVVKQKGLRYKIPTVTTDNYWRFLPIGESEYTAISPEALVECVGSVTYCVSKDHSKALSNVLVEPCSGGKIRAVGSDGLRLALHNAIGVINREMLLSATNSKALKKYLSDKTELALFSDGALVHLLTPQGFLKVRASNQKYVDYKAVLPQGPYKTVMFKTEDMCATLMRTLLFKAENPIVTLEMSSNAIRIELINKEGEGVETIAAESDFREATSVCLNPRHVLDCLEHMGDAPLRLRYYGVDHPVVITDDLDSLALLTQVRSK